MLEMGIIPVITTAGVRDHLPRLHQPSTFDLNISRFLRIKSIVDSGIRWILCFIVYCWKFRM